MYESSKTVLLLVFVASRFDWPLTNADLRHLVLGASALTLIARSPIEYTAVGTKASLWSLESSHRDFNAKEFGLCASGTVVRIFEMLKFCCEIRNKELFGGAIVCQLAKEERTRSCCCFVLSSQRCAGLALFLKLDTECLFLFLVSQYFQERMQTRLWFVLFSAAVQRFTV